MLQIQLSFDAWLVHTQITELTDLAENFLKQQLFLIILEGL